MDIGRQKLKLEANIAAVRLGEFALGEDVVGVAVTIPAGEVVHVDRRAPVVRQMQQIEWNGSRYGVFGEDLLDRTDQLKTGAGTN